MNTKRVFAAACIMATMPFSTNSAKADRFFGFGVGVDQQTLEFVNSILDRLPDVGKKILEEISPVVTATVNENLKNMQKALNQSIDHAAQQVSCLAETAPASFFEAAKETILGSYARKVTGQLTPAGTKHPTIDMVNAVFATKESIRPDTSTVLITGNYADLFVAVGLAKCKSNLGQVVTTYISQYYDISVQALEAPAMEWMIVTGNPLKPWCANPMDCVEKRREYMTNFLKAADSRDKVVEVTIDIPGEEPKIFTYNVDDRFGAIPEIPQPGFFSRPDISTYEDVLISYRNLERTVEVLRAKRLKRAAVTLELANKQLDGAKKNVKGNYDNMHSSKANQIDADNMLHRYSGIVTSLDNSLSAADDALKLDPSLAKTIGDFKLSAATTLKNLDDLKVFTEAWQAERDRDASIQEMQERRERGRWGMMSR